jgi:hypothetical protein
MAAQRSILCTNEWKLYHRSNDGVGIRETQRHRAEREAVQVVDGSIDRVKYPKELATGDVTAFLLTEKVGVGHPVMEEFADEVFHGHVDV